MRRAYLFGIVLALLIAWAGLRACSRGRPKLSAIESDQTRPAAEWLKEEPVRLLRDYVRIDTTESKGEEEGARFLQKIFECAGIPSELVCPTPRRCNLLARLPGRHPAGALLLLNHIDVVSAYQTFWKEAGPFEGKIKNGFLYGRGAYDMKSLGLAQALAVANLKQHGIVPDADVLFLAEADEELGQKWGARWLLEHRPEWFQGVANVLNEGGTNETILRDVRFWGLETLQAGVAWAEFESTSREPLEGLAKKWPKLALPAVEPHPQVVEGFGMLANHLGSPLTDPLRHLDRVRRDPAELSILPDRYGSFLEARIFWTSVYPFPPDSSPPESAQTLRILVVISVPPAVSPTPYLSPILAAALREKIRVVRSLSSEPASASPYRKPDGDLVPFVALLKRVTEARYSGIPFGPVPTYGGYTTSILFRQRGFKTYGYSPIPMNITDAARRHGNDERIFLRDFLNGVRLYADILEEFALRPEEARGARTTGNQENVTGFR